MSAGWIMQFQVPDLEHDRRRELGPQEDSRLGNSCARYTKKIELGFSRRLNVFNERKRRNDQGSNQNKGDKS